MSDADPPHDPQRAAQRDRDRAAVERIRDGDSSAFGELFDDWYDRVVDLARTICHDTQAAEDVAQDTFVTAWEQLDRLADPASFGGWILRIARNRAYDRSRREQRTHAVDDRTMAMMEETDAIPASGPAGLTAEDRLGRAADPETAATDHEIVALLWESAAALGDRDRDVLHLHLRHNLAPAEIGEVLEINRNAANQLVHRVRQRLDTAVRARVLWRSGRVDCPDLSRELDAGDVVVYDADAVKIAQRHAGTCDRCADSQRMRLQPSALFSAIPVLAVPLLSRQRAAAELASHGVPMHGSSVAPDGGTSHDADPPNDGRPQGNGAAHDGPASPPGDPTAPHGGNAAPRRRRWALPVALVLLAVPVAVIAWAEHAGDRSVEVRSAEGTRTTDTPGVGVRGAPGADPQPSGALVDPTIVGTTAVTPTTTTLVVSTTTIVDAPQSTTTTVPPTVALSVTMSERASGDALRQYAPGDVQSHDYVGTPIFLGATRLDPAPRVRWQATTTTDATGWSLRVRSASGDLLAGGPLDGSLAVCPGLEITGGCELIPGTYDYTVELLDDTATVRASQTVSFLATRVR